MTWTATIALERQQVNFSSHIEDVHHRILREPAIQEVAGRIENIAHLDGAIYAAIMLAKALDVATTVHLIGHDKPPGVFIRVEAAPLERMQPEIESDTAKLLAQTRETTKAQRAAEVAGEDIGDIPSMVLK